MLSPINVVARKSQLVGILERIGQQLELSDAQAKLAEERYEAVGNWLAESKSKLLATALIYVHGSVGLQTTTRPIKQNEHDIDLMCLIRGATLSMEPAVLKKFIGDRLKEHWQYSSMLEEKPRCWRINYANEFHLDITPSIWNIACANGGELVPDKRLREWKPTNPKAYRKKFEYRASLRPRMILREALAKDMRAQIEALPERTEFKGLLRRTVQLSKRHRDTWFSEQREPALAPISMILTTLLAQSYQSCVTHNVYETELDLFMDVLRGMKDYIGTSYQGTRQMYYVWNETTVGENFAEKWNDNPRLPEAFYRWHAAAVADFERLISLSGLDVVTDALSKSFGDRIVSGAMGSSVSDLSAARTSGKIWVAPAIGLAAAASAHSTPVRSNTFFGI